MVKLLILVPFYLWVEVYKISDILKDIENGRILYSLLDMVYFIIIPIGAIIALGTDYNKWKSKIKSIFYE